MDILLSVSMYPYTFIYTVQILHIHSKSIIKELLLYSEISQHFSDWSEAISVLEEKFL